MGEQCYQAVLLDVDGTLLDFGQSEKFGMKVVLSYYGFEPSEALLNMYHRVNEAAWTAFERGEVTKERLLTGRFERFFGLLGKKVDGGEAERLYRRQLDESAILIEGALEVCRYLKERYRVYIVTNGTSSTQYKRLRASGLDVYTDDIFVSEDAGSQKPQKEYFDYCFDRMDHIPRKAAVIVGDSLNSDIKGGNEAGIDTCWYNPGGLPITGDVSATYEIRRLEELMDILACPPAGGPQRDRD